MNSFTIRHTTERDLPAILQTYAYARAQMKKTGNPNQWGDSRPKESLVRSDVENGLSFVLEQDGEIVGVFVFYVGIDPCYLHIEEGNWLNDEPYGVIHRVASNGKAHGVLREIVRFCEKQVGNLRIDTHQDNRIMRHLIESCGFTPCGIITVDNGTKRIAYQKKGKTRMKNWIWDLDGTLLDSYAVIVPSVTETLREFGMNLSETEIFRRAIETSVNDILADVSQKLGVPSDVLKEKTNGRSRARIDQITAIPHAKDILVRLKEQGGRHFVFTNRGATSLPILARLGMLELFDEVVTAEQGFPRKPNPEGVLYLMKKHRLEPAQTCYVGDRLLDVDCAKEAGIQSVLYLPEGSFCIPNGNQTYLCKDLLEIADL